MTNRTETAFPARSSNLASDDAGALESLKRRVKQGQRLATQKVIERPAVSLAVAALAGLVLGRMWKRK